MALLFSISMLVLLANSTSLGQAKVAPAGVGSTESFSSSAHPHEVHIRGVVKGPKGPLPGAIVQAVGTKALAVTAADGKFDLEVPTTEATIEIKCSYAGLADEVVKLSATETKVVIQMLKRVPRTVAEPVLESGWW